MPRVIYFLKIEFNIYSTIFKAKNIIDSKKNFDY